MTDCKRLKGFSREKAEEYLRYFEHFYRENLFKVVVRCHFKHLKVKRFGYMRKLFILLLLLFSLPLFAANKAIVLTVKGTLTPATQDYLDRGFRYARAEHAEIIILQLNTPGGLETVMRAINELILTSTIPVVVYVAPAGARAASAGPFLLYAAHVAAMARGTNVGAASPVSLTEKKGKIATAAHNKATNDAVAYLRSLATLRNRNANWAESAVRQAASIANNEALQQHVIEINANDLTDLLKQLNNRTINIQNSQQTLHTTDLTLDTFKPDWHFQFLSIITDPNIAYILLLLGIYGLFFEFMNPGFIVPGVIGGIALLLALFAFNLLPVNYAGLSLLLMGIVFIVSEIFITSYGVLGIGGVIAFVLGSIILFDVNSSGYYIAWQIILTMSLISVGFFLLILYLTINSFRQSVVTGQEGLLNKEGEVLEYKNNNDILIRTVGEIWHAHSSMPLHTGQRVKIVKIIGLTVSVEPVE